jgi:hypothetical protein
MHRFFMLWKQYGDPCQKTCLDDDVFLFRGKQYDDANYQGENKYKFITNDEER